MPWVGFGYDAGEAFELVRRTKRPIVGRNTADLERSALRTLRRRPASWQRWDVQLGQLGRLPMLACEDDDFAAERILDVAFMSEAQRVVGGRGLLAAVPRRGALMVTDDAADEPRLVAFLALASQQYHEAGPAAVSGAVFAVRDGHIHAIVDVAADVAAAAAGTADLDDGSEPADDEPYVANILLRDRRTGLESLLITAVHGNFDRLMQALTQTLTAAVPEHIGKPYFSGEVEVVIASSHPSASVHEGGPADASGPRGGWDTRAERNLARLRAHLGGVASRLAAASGRPLRVSVRAETT